MFEIQPLFSFSASPLLLQFGHITVSTLLFNQMFKLPVVHDMTHKLCLMYGKCEPLAVRSVEGTSLWQGQ